MPLSSPVYHHDQLEKTIITVASAICTACPLHDEALDRNAKFVKECSCLLLVYTDIENERNVSNLISVGAFIEHLCLAAYDNGIGALWNRYIARMMKEINDHLGIKDKYLVSGVLLGYYDGELGIRPRKSLDEIIMK